MLGPKSYMMGVSPFFYTNIPEYNKNWLWGPDTLWYDRWEQVLDLLPDFVEIMYALPLRSLSGKSSSRLTWGRGR